MNPAHEDRLRALEVDVDTRLADIWALAWEPDTLIGELMDGNPRLAESVGKLMRAAYGAGYCQALDEVKQGRRGELARANGYRPL
jgi:hypothetical protein